MQTGWHNWQSWKVLSNETRVSQGRSFEEIFWLTNIQRGETCGIAGERIVGVFHSMQIFCLWHWFSSSDAQLEHVATYPVSRSILGHQKCLLMKFRVLYAPVWQVKWDMWAQASTWVLTDSGTKWWLTGPPPEPGCWCWALQTMDPTSHMRIAATWEAGRMDLGKQGVSSLQCGWDNTLDLIFWQSMKLNWKLLNDLTCWYSASSLSEYKPRS